MFVVGILRVRETWSRLIAATILTISNFSLLFNPCLRRGFGSVD